LLDYRWSFLLNVRIHKRTDRGAILGGMLGQDPRGSGSSQARPYSNDRGSNGKRLRRDPDAARGEYPPNRRWTEPDNGELPEPRANLSVCTRFCTLRTSVETRLRMSEHGHNHDHRHGSQRALLIALVFTTFFAVVEAVAGWWSNSLALVGDAGHMITDSVALGLGAAAAWVSRRPPSLRHSYGLKRAESLGALLNIVFMLAVIVYIGVEAIRRLASPQPVDGQVVMLVAAIGLFVNLGAAWVLHRGEQNLNVRGAMLHVLGDLLGSVAALAAGAVIWFTGWYPIDPILSAFIGALILVGSLRLLRDVVHIVMEGVPRNVNLEELGQAIADVAYVNHVHDLHVWALDSVTYAVSAHVVIDDMADWSQCRRQVEETLAAKFGIAHSTLQPEGPSTFAHECADGSCGPIFSSRRFEQ
jgi:cobalt-zinc-cadmium efflux system protein